MSPLPEPKPILRALLLSALCLLCACSDKRSPPHSSSHETSNGVAPVRASPTPQATESHDASGEMERPRDASAEEADRTGDFEGTAGVTEKRRDGRAPVVLREVRAARHDDFDRVVFEFEGDALPGYRVEYVDRPVRQCGSGRAVALEGEGWLRVSLRPAYAHTERGEPTVAERERRIGFPNLKELKMVCDFEADVEWALGLSSPERYRVLELQGPARLVLDVKH